MTEQVSLSGSCAFRLMPTDDLVEAPSQLTVNPVGDGQLACSYTWSHPGDGPQHGLLLISGPDPQGDVTASWADSWHQQPDLLTLSGPRTGDTVELSAVYAGEWGWQISLQLLPGAASMTMRNVIPESAVGPAASDAAPDAPPLPAGPYPVMVATWSAPAS
jgi:hypothetical protein